MYCSNQLLKRDSNTEQKLKLRHNMADQLNMHGLSLDSQHGQGRSAYIPPHMRGMPPPQMDGPPPMNGPANGSAWNGPSK